MAQLISSVANQIHIEPTGCVKIDNNTSSNGMATFVWFRPGESDPAWIIKVPRNPAFTDHIEREGQVLASLHSRFNSQDHLGQQIPDLVGYTCMGNSQALVVSVLPGKSMSRWMQGRRVAASAELAADWLAQFHRKTFVRQSTIDEGYVQDLIYHYLNSLSHRSAQVTTKVAGEIEKVQENVYHYLLKTYGMQVPITAVHGDFNPHNILVIKRKISGVIDWSEARLEGLPYEDLLHFLIVAITSDPRAMAHEGNPSNIWKKIVSHAELFREYIHRYSKAMEVDASPTLAFVPWYLLITALKELLPWRTDVASCRYWLRLVQDSIEHPMY
jgi:thiamine kinase-like enzyme